MEHWWIKNWCLRTITVNGKDEWVWRFPGKDHVMTPTGDIVTRFEAERLFGLHEPCEPDYDDQVDTFSSAERNHYVLVR